MHREVLSPSRIRGPPLDGNVCDRQNSPRKATITQPACLIEQSVCRLPHLQFLPVGLPVLNSRRSWYLYRSIAAVLQKRMVFGNPFTPKSTPLKLSETDDAGDGNDVNPAGDTNHDYPSGQLFVLGCCRLSEPVSMTSSSPYLYFMIRDFGITGDEKEIGRYVGFLASCYSFSQCLTGTHSS